ncbi:YihY/virulence factor BrkB family protein [Candidatus Manganitrophus noduliformans]|uniref:YihY/virulence factor BrkB family protein n=1 Tax=Candidatus Manganitrophus noduliformans TaxID=2606439 RepID=UPI00143B1021|nr:YihY/virulence factor BrkB family protein [Candidatus Manganitrophus noduliformans]
MEVKGNNQNRLTWRERFRRWALGTLTPRQLAADVWKQINEDDIFSVAAELAYFSLFALFPLLLFLVTLIGYLPVENLYQELLGYLQQVLPAEAMALVQKTLNQIVREQRGGLLSIGLAVTLWAASRGMAAIINALNKAYGVKEERPWWKVQATALGLTVSLSVFIIFSAVLMIFGGAIGEWLANWTGLGASFLIGWNLLRLFLATLIMITVVAAIYYFGPDVEQEWRWVTPGSVLAVLGWIAVSLAFSYYVSHFGNYNKTYGAIGAVIILLTWMYLSALMILLGAEINSEIERSLPEGKSNGEKRLAHKHPGDLLLQARAKAPVSGRIRKLLFSPWSLGGLAALSATTFYFLRRRRRSSEA